MDKFSLSHELYTKPAVQPGLEPRLREPGSVHYDRQPCQDPHWFPYVLKKAILTMHGAEAVVSW